MLQLNIGGSLICTTKETLCGGSQSGANNFFHRLLSGDIGSTMDSATGAYFIDRDAQPFRYILTYLRCGVLRCPRQLYPSVLAEAQYYGIELPERHVEVAPVSTVTMHVYAPSSPQNYVKAMCVEIYGGSAQLIQELLCELERNEEHGKNQMEVFPVEKDEPNIRKQLIKNAYDVSLVHNMISRIQNSGHALLTHQSVVVGPIDHRKTETSYMRRHDTFIFSTQIQTKKDVDLSL